MENVPQVIGGGAIADFVQWREFLEGLGYKNYTQLMNAKGYGIPQNRNRCFMVSILGDYDYIFPPELPLQYRLKDFLERHVDKKYYLSDRAVEMFIESTAKNKAKGNGFKFEPTNGGGYAKSVLTRPGERACDNFIIEQGDEVRESDGVCGDPNGERLQGLRQPSNERRGGKFDSVILETSEKYNAGPLEEISRSITTEGKNGVIEWTESSAKK